MIMTQEQEAQATAGMDPQRTIFRGIDVVHAGDGLSHRRNPDYDSETPRETALRILGDAADMNRRAMLSTTTTDAIDAAQKVLEEGFPSLALKMLIDHIPEFQKWGGDATKIGDWRPYQGESLQHYLDRRGRQVDD